MKRKQTHPRRRMEVDADATNPTTFSFKQRSLPSDSPFHLHADDHAGAVDADNAAPAEMTRETTDMIHDIVAMTVVATGIANENDHSTDFVKEETIDVATGSVSVTNRSAAADDALEIWEPQPLDVLTGRGASINVHPGNQKFRALCYARKSQFDAANHAAKKRIATEIWTTCEQLYNSRFLSRRQEKGPWYQQSAHHAILKAAQTIRDYQRPDRLLQRDFAGTKKRRCTPATPMDEVVVPPPPEGPIVENPEGVDANDVLCGRGAFVNGHKGNQYLRQLAVARKAQFEAGTYSEKRLLATEIVNAIKALDPPGRFLRRLPKVLNETSLATTTDFSYAWEELDLEKSIHKACQVMRDIDRQDRKHRLERKLAKINRMQNLYTHLLDESKLEEEKIEAPTDVEGVLDAIGAMDTDGASNPTEDVVHLSEHVQDHLA